MRYVKYNKQITLRLKEDEYNKIIAYADNHQDTISNILRTIILDQIERTESL